MKPTQCPARTWVPNRLTFRLTLPAVILVWTFAAVAQSNGSHFNAKVNVTNLQTYNGAALPKPAKILVYDFTIDTSNVQVDQSQKMRPRHMISGDDNPESVAKKASAKFSDELIAKLAKTGIPVEHATSDATAPANTLSVQGAFSSLKQGNKAERDVVGMGTGSADVQAKVDVRLKTVSDAVLLSEFQTDIQPAENMGAAVPAVAGMDPAAVAVKAKVGDRRKTLEAYASKTADAMAGEIMKEMAKQGWIQLNDKGEVVQ